MAAPPRYNPDTGEWEDPSDYTPPGRDQDPYAPPGYTVPSAPPPGPDPYTLPSEQPLPEHKNGTVATPQTSGGGGGGFSGSFTAPDRQSYPSLPTVPDAPLPNLPQFQQVPAFSYDPYQQAGQFSYDPYAAPDPFKAPSVEDALQDPSYQFRKQQGEESLQHWAAARGTLNDSGTAKALIDYGGNSASQEYSNIWNRDLNAYNTNEGNRYKTYTTNRGNALENFNTNEANRAAAYNTNRAGAVQQYNTNYQTQYADPYKAAYQSAIDTWIPQQETWRAGVDMSRLGYTTQTGVVLHDNDMNYANAWQRYLQDYTQWKNGPLNDQAFVYGMS